MKTVLVTCAVLLISAPRAPAATVTNFGSQFSDLTAQTNNGQNFKRNFTGRVNLEGNANSAFVGALIGNVFQGNPGGFALGDLFATIRFSKGVVRGGRIEFTLTDGTNVDTFTARVAKMKKGTVRRVGDQLITRIRLRNIDLVSSSGGNTFAGFDVEALNRRANMRFEMAAGTNFDDAASLLPRAIVNHFGPVQGVGGNGNGNGNGGATHLPLPPAVWAGLLGLAGVGFMRRRAKM